VARTIAMFNLNDTRRDPRVRRIGRSLINSGHRVIVFEMLGASDAEYDEIDGIEIRRVPVPMRYEAEDMAEFRDLCRAAFDVIARCDAAVAGDRPAWYRNRGHRLATLRGRWRRRAGDSEPAAAAAPGEIAAIRSIMLINLAIYKSAIEIKPDIAHCNDLDTLLIGYIFKRNHKIPVVFDAHEIYPEQLSEDMRSETWYQFYTRLEEILIHIADGRMTVCESLADYFDKRYGAAGFKTVLNVPSAIYLPAPEILERRRQRRKLLYHGAYAAYRGLEEIIHAVRWLEDADVIFRGIGSHQEKLKKLCHSEGADDRVTFAAPVTIDRLIATAADCDIGLNPFVPNCKNTEYALPNKFFEYMMAGLGCASSDLVELRRLSSQLRVGVTFPNLEPRRIADRLNELLASPDQIDEFRCNAYHAARDRYNWEHEEQSFLSYYSRFLN
jgi:glycogen(starch) synthase